MDTAPDMNGAVVIAANTNGVAGARGGNIQIVDPSTGEVHVIGSVPGATALAAGNLHDVLVIAGTEATRLLMAPTPLEDNPSGEVPPPPTSVTLPHAAQAVAFDSATSQWVLVSFTDAKLMRLAQDLSGPVDVQDIPASVPLGSSGRIAVSANAAVWLITNGSSFAYRLTVPAGAKGGGELEALEATLTGVTQPTAIDFLASGRMVIADNAVITELESKDPAMWTPVSEPEIDVTCPVVTLVVDEDVIGTVPGYHDAPDWFDNPDLIVPGIDVPDPVCFADLNGDGTVDAGDLGILIGDWGPNGGSGADFNTDGIVDGADLGKLLAAWGDCPGT